MANTPSKSAASKTAASKAEAAKTATPANRLNPDSQGTNAPGAAGSGDSGPGTAQATPPPESETTGTRPPTGTLDRSGATPLEAPDAAHQETPEQGHPESSTNPVAANAATRTTPGENHIRLVDEKGKAVDAAKIFDKADGPQTFVTVNTRVYEEFTYPGSERKTTRLVYPEGAHVDALTAERFKAAHAAAHA